MKVNAYILLISMFLAVVFLSGCSANASGEYSNKEDKNKLTCVLADDPCL